MASDTVHFPFKAFPPLLCAIGFGSLFLPNTKTQRALQAVPDFILVIDDDKLSVEKWHELNAQMNPSHYSKLSSIAISGLIKDVGPQVFHAPMVTINFVHGNASLPRAANCLVVGKKALVRDLNEWSHFYLAGRLQKPALIITPDTMGGSIAGGVMSFDSPLSPLAEALQVNTVNATRLSMLLSDRTFGFRDLVRTAATLSYTGDLRSNLMESLSRSRRSIANNLLLFSRMYWSVLPRVRREWKLILEEGDDEIVTGRYQPPGFDRTEAIGVGSFSLKSEDPTDDQTVAEILSKTQNDVDQLAKDTFAARLTGQVIPKTPAHILEATRYLTAKELTLQQSYNSEAHCSLYHSLPDNIQLHAISSSARLRLNRILNPLNLLNSEKDRDILGGPLPWEKVCMKDGIRAVVKKSARLATVKAVISGGPMRTGFVEMQRWFNRALV